MRCQDGCWGPCKAGSLNQVQQLLKHWFPMPVLASSQKERVLSDTGIFFSSMYSPLFWQKFAGDFFLLFRWVGSFICRKWILKRIGLSAVRSFFTSCIFVKYLYGTFLEAYRKKQSNQTAEECRLLHLDISPVMRIPMRFLTSYNHIKIAANEAIFPSAERQRSTSLKTMTVLLQQVVGAYAMYFSLICVWGVVKTKGYRIY